MDEDYFAYRQLRGEILSRAEMTTLKQYAERDNVNSLIRFFVPRTNGFRDIYSVKDRITNLPNTEKLLSDTKALLDKINITDIPNISKIIDTIRNTDIPSVRDLATRARDLANASLAEARQRLDQFGQSVTSYGECISNRAADFASLRSQFVGKAFTDFRSKLSSPSGSFRQHVSDLADSSNGLIADVDKRLIKMRSDIKTRWDSMKSKIDGVGSIGLDAHAFRTVTAETYSMAGGSGTGLGQFGPEVYGQGAAIRDVMRMLGRAAGHVAINAPVMHDPLQDLAKVFETGFKQIFGGLLGAIRQPIEDIRSALVEVRDRITDTLGDLGFHSTKSVEDIETAIRDRMAQVRDRLSELDTALSGWETSLKDPTQGLKPKCTFGVPPPPTSTATTTTTPKTTTTTTTSATQIGMEAGRIGQAIGAAEARAIKRYRDAVSRWRESPPEALPTAPSPQSPPENPMPPREPEPPHDEFDDLSHLPEPIQSILRKQREEDK